MKETLILILLLATTIAEVRGLALTSADSAEMEASTACSVILDTSQPTVDAPAVPTTALCARITDLAKDATFSTILSTVTVLPADKDVSHAATPNTVSNVLEDTIPAHRDVDNAPSVLQDVLPVPPLTTVLAALSSIDLRTVNVLKFPGSKSSCGTYWDTAVFLYAVPAFVF